MPWDTLAQLVAKTSQRVMRAEDAAGVRVTYRPFAGGSVDIDAEFLAAHTLTDPEIGTVVDDVGPRLWVTVADLPAAPLGGDESQADQVDIPAHSGQPVATSYYVSRVMPEGDGVDMLELTEVEA